MMSKSMQIAKSNRQLNSIMKDSDDGPRELMFGRTVEGFRIGTGFTEGSEIAEMSEVA